MRQKTKPEPLAPEDFAAAVNRLVLTRWGAAALVVALTLLCVHGFAIPLPTVWLLGLAAGLAAYNGIFTLLDGWLERMPGLERDQRVRWYRRLVVAQV